jgi:4-amino-4-deoxy-L-arabinose transferase-like glycosyltransferase
MFAIAFPIFGAYIILSRLYPRLSHRYDGMIVTFSISGGLVFGVTSCAYFLWLLFLGIPSTNYHIFENICLVILISIALYKSRHRKIDSCKPDTGSDFSIYLHILSIGFLIIVICFIAAFFLKSAVNPHGWEDAWSMWNLKARLLFRGGENWRNTFSSLLSWTSPDYPLLVPLSIVRIWGYSGHESTTAQILVAALFTFATVALLVGSLSVIRSRSAGLLAGLVLIGSPYFLKTGAYQIADVPLGFYILATIVLFSLAEGADLKPRFLVIAGAMTGFAAWTKNEGLLFLLVVPIVRMIVTISSRGIKACMRELAMFAVGLLPIVLVLLRFKLEMASSSELFAGQSADMVWDRLTDSSRYLIICKSFIVFFYDKLAKEWLIVLPIYFFVVGKAKQKLNKESIKTCCLSMLFMLGGYFFVYLITPLNLQWHIETSIWRLFLQLWPTMIFSFFMIVSTPEEWFNERRPAGA